MKKVFVSIMLFSIIISSIVYAHPGRTDSNGGHYDRSTGTYHYHNGGSYYDDNKEISNNEKQSWQEFWEEENKWITTNELLEESKKETIFEDYNLLTIQLDEKSKTVSNLMIERENLVTEHENIIKRLLISFSVILVFCMFICYNLGMLYSKNRYKNK